MRQIEQHYRREFPMLLVYRDDLEQLVSVVKQHCERVEITAGKYQIDSLEALDDLHLETLPSFRVHGFNSAAPDGTTASSMLSVDLRPGELSNVYVSNETFTQLLGAAVQLEQILSKRSRRRLQQWTRAWVMFAGELAFAAVGSVAIAFVTFWVLAQPRQSVPVHLHPTVVFWVVLIVGAFICALAWPFAIMKVRLANGFKISMEYSYQHSTFWQRKKDDIALALISGFIGLFVGVVTTLLLAMLTKL